MGEVALPPTGLLSRISLLFNSSLYSDVEFHFINEEGELVMKMYGHKLILALQSKAFAYLFFENKDPLKVIELPASKQVSFYDLIKFLYTGNVQFHTYEKTQDLFELAKAYAVEELSSKCCDYIVKNQLNFSNIFSRYDYALEKNVKKLLSECRKFICCNTEQIIKSSGFHNASVEIVEDILKQDNLNVSSELDLIEAVINWALEDMQKIDMLSRETYLRERLDVVLKYLRVLTLSSIEFEYLIENYNLFSSYETMVITRKILQPECNVKIPKGLCSITEKRNNLVLDASASDQDIPEVSFENLHKSVKFESSMYIQDETVKTFENKICDGSRLESDDLSMFREISLDTKNLDKKVIFKPDVSMFTDKSLETKNSEKPVIFEAPSPLKKESNKLSLLNVSARGYNGSVNKRSHHLTNNYLQKETKFSPSRLKSTKFSSTPDLKRIIFGQQTEDLPQGQLRDYTIPLKESEKCFGLSFRDDIKSYITFKMKNGNLSLRGFEIKVVHSSSKPEELEVFVHLEGFSSQTFSNLYKKELDSDFVTIKFPKAMLLKEGNKGELEVSIDNLLCSRCSTCYSNKQFELNNGLGFAAEITLNSNKKTDNGFLFLVSKLFYVPF